MRAMKMSNDATGQASRRGKEGEAGWRGNAGPDGCAGGNPTTGFLWPLWVKGDGLGYRISNWP